MLKKLTLSAALLGAVLTAGSAQAIPDDLRTTLCPQFAELAYDIMQARQEGASQTKLLGFVSDPEAPAPMVKFMTQVVKEAYDQPMWHSSSTKEDAAVRFRDQVENACLG